MTINPESKAMSPNINPVISLCSFQTQSSISGSIFHPGPGKETDDPVWERPCPQDPRTPVQLCPGSRVLHPNLPILSHHSVSDHTPFYKAKVYASQFFKFKTMLRIHIVTDNKTLKEIRNFLMQTFCLHHLKCSVIVIFAISF